MPNIVLGLFWVDHCEQDLTAKSAKVGIRAEVYPFTSLGGEDGGPITHTVYDCAMKAGGIVFFLDGLEPKTYHTRHMARWMYTNQELDMVLHNPVLLAKTRFFRAGCELSVSQVLEEFDGVQDAGVPVSSVQTSDGGADSGVVAELYSGQGFWRATV
jgi:hypothetical protein